MPDGDNLINVFVAKFADVMLCRHVL
jgi:hypothetical protein